MQKKFFIELLIFFSILLITKAEEESDKEDEYGTDYFKETLKQYLIGKNLFDSEEPVQPEEMKKIFLEVITEGEAESSADYFGGIFNELADYFVNSYYVNRKEIKGKQIYDLIDIEAISQKFEQMIGNNPQFYDNDCDDEENNDYDTRDDVGEATSDV